MTKLTFLFAMQVSLMGAVGAQQPNKELPSEKFAQQLIVPAREPLQAGATGVGVSLDVETVNPRRVGEQFVYSAKFLCGKIPHSPSDPQDPPLSFPLVPGTYRTAINIVNANPGEAAFTKTALTTNPEGQPRGKAGAPVREVL